MYILLLSFITAILGGLKNIVKYKQFNFLLFIRTPILVLLISKILYLFNVTYITTNILLSLILERWYLFIYKIIKNIINNNYNIKKDKYIKKYNLIYK